MQSMKPGFYWRPPGSRKPQPIPKEAADVLRLGGFDVWEVKPFEAHADVLFEYYSRRVARISSNRRLPLAHMN